MKGSDFKPNEKTIKLLDGNHKIAIDFNAFEQLENIYGDLQTAFNKFSTGNVKFADIKNFLCAGMNACCEKESDYLTPFEVGKLLDIDRLTEYVTVLGELMNRALPDAKGPSANDDDDPN